MDAAEQKGPTLDEITPESLCDLSGLNNDYDGSRFAAASLNTASLFKDDIGVAYYDNCLWITAMGDLNLFAEGVRRVYKRHQEQALHSEAREYLRVTLTELADQRAKDDQRRQRQAEHDQRDQEAQERAREAVARAVMTAISQPPVADPEPDELIKDDPFADEEPAPAPVAAHPAVIRARQDLALGESLEHLQALFTGVCRGRESVWALCMSVLPQGYRSLTALVSKIAAEHREKDDFYCADRAQGMTVAERTAMLKEFEQALEGEKQALNPPMTPLGGFRSDTMMPVASVVGGIMDAAAKTAKSEDGVPLYLAAVTLPRHHQGWSALENAMDQMRDKFASAEPSLQYQANAAGNALANSKSANGNTLWESWRKVGVYYAFLALRQNAVRAENVARAQAVDQEADHLDQEAHQDTDEEDPFMP